MTNVQNSRGAYTILDFTQNFGISRTRAFAEIKAGRLAALKCGRRTLITQEAAEEWLHNLPARNVR